MTYFHVKIVIHIKQNIQATDADSGTNKNIAYSLNDENELVQH